jgi:hypothetical protein
MSKWALAVFAMVLGAAVVVVWTQAGTPTASAGADAGATPSTASGALALAGEPRDAGGLGEEALALPPAPLDPNEPLLDLGEPLAVDAGGALLPSGEAPPSLPEDAPKSVEFGVILVTYRGAQGAPRDARSREEALTLAKELAAAAKDDFAAAVARGDPGSTENAGSIPRHVLEPAPNYVLFSTPVGEVGEPVDTPRGFWIVRRIK